MLYCSHCGRQNADDSKFCDRCGSPVILGQKPGQTQAIGPAPPAPPAPSPDDFGKGFGERMSSAGERFGREMSRMSETLGREFEGAGRRLESRYERRFGLAGPFIRALIGWGILVLIILGIQAARTPGGELAYPELGVYLGGNVLLFFGLLILFGYVTYAHRRYRRQAVWVLPLTVAAGITVLSWFASGALSALSDDTGDRGIADAASAGQTFLPVIFIAILILGYIAVFAGSRGSGKDTPIPPELGR